MGDLIPLGPSQHYRIEGIKWSLFGPPLYRKSIFIVSRRTDTIYSSLVLKIDIFSILRDLHEWGHFTECTFFRTEILLEKGANIFMIVHV